MDNLFYFVLSFYDFIYMLFTVYIYTAQHYIAIRDTRKVYLLIGTGWIVLRCTCRPTSLAEKSHSDQLLFFLSLPCFFFEVFVPFAISAQRVGLERLLLPQKLSSSSDQCMDINVWIWTNIYQAFFYINICVFRYLLKSTRNTHRII